MWLSKPSSQTHHQPSTLKIFNGIHTISAFHHRATEEALPFVLISSSGRETHGQKSQTSGQTEPIEQFNSDHELAHGMDGITGWEKQHHEEPIKARSRSSIHVNPEILRYKHASKLYPYVYSISTITLSSLISTESRRNQGKFVCPFLRL